MIKLTLRFKFYGEPVARANKWGKAARKILEGTGWSDDDVATIANSWHPGLVVNGVPRWASVGPVQGPAGNAARGHPALYLQWEHGGGKLDEQWSLASLSDMSGKQRYANFELISAALLVDQCYRLADILRAKKSGEKVSDEYVWRALYWGARFHANICRVRSAAKGSAGGRPKGAVTRNAQAATTTVTKVTVAYDGFRKQGVAARSMASRISAGTSVSAPTVRGILDKHRPNWRTF